MIELSYILGIVIFGVSTGSLSCQTPGNKTTLLPERATMASLKLLASLTNSPEIRLVESTGVAPIIPQAGPNSLKMSQTS